MWFLKRQEVLSNYLKSFVNRLRVNDDNFVSAKVVSGHSNDIARLYNWLNNYWYWRCERPICILTHLSRKSADIGLVKHWAEMSYFWFHSCMPTYCTLIGWKFIKITALHVDNLDNLLCWIISTCARSFFFQNSISTTYNIIIAACNSWWHPKPSTSLRWGRYIHNRR